MHGVDLAGVEQAPGQHVGRPVAGGLVRRRVVLVTHPGQRSVELEAQLAACRRRSFGDGDELAHAPDSTRGAAVSPATSRHCVPRPRRCSAAHRWPLLGWRLVARIGETADVTQPTLDEFTAAATAFLDATATPKDADRKFVWGEGSDNVAMFEERTREEEDAVDRRRPGIPPGPLRRRLRMDHRPAGVRRSADWTSSTRPPTTPSRVATRCRTRAPT